MNMTDAAIGWGSKFQIWDAASSPPAFQDMGEVSSITPPARQKDQIDATHMQSPNRTREFIAGLTDPGEAGFTMNFVPGSASDDRLLALDESGDTVEMRIVFPNNVTWTFDGFVSGYQPAVPVDDKMTADVTIKVSGSTNVGVIT
jgi:predicted secreted protein